MPVLIVVNYHYVRSSYDAPHPGIHGLTPFRFEAQLLELGRVGEFVHPADVRAAARGTAALPERAILVTFDDGLREGAALLRLIRVGEGDRADAFDGGEEGGAARRRAVVGHGKAPLLQVREGRARPAAAAGSRAGRAPPR